MELTIKKALVISGGASKIPFGIGVASELLKQNKYDLYVGISAGAIISLFASVNKLENLYSMAINFKLSDMFSICPVNKKGHLSFISILRLLFGKSSLGKNKRFRNKIKSMFTRDDYLTLRDSSCEVVVGVTNYNLKCIEYPVLKEYNYEDLIDWVYFSSNIPLATEPNKYNNSWYFDGGMIDYVGIYQAIDMGATDIDVILHSPMDNIITENDLKWEPTSVVEIAKRTIEILLNNIEFDDILLAMVVGQDKKINIKFFFPTSDLSNGNTYNFDPILLKSWYELGVQTANNKIINNLPCQKFLTT